MCVSVRERESVCVCVYYLLDFGRSSSACVYAGPIVCRSVCDRMKRDRIVRIEECM